MTIAMYDEEYRRRWQMEADERQRQEEQNRRENASLRERRLAKLEAMEKAQQAEREAKREAALAADKERERRRWLIEHPDHTTADFEQRAWPHLRAALLHAQEEAEREHLREHLQATGAYASM